MSSNKIYIHKLKSIFTAGSGGGGCGCRPKPTNIVEPQTKSEPSFSSDQKSSFLPSSSATSSAASHRRKSDADAWSSSTFSLIADASPHRHPKILNGFAVVKDSNDPYHDFQQSMLQMICEKRIYSADDLQQLLDCFLLLNSPRYHEVIVRAFFEIWGGGGGSHVKRLDDGCGVAM